jgi:predicted alpha/beta hydrolase family esterase
VVLNRRNPEDVIENKTGKEEKHTDEMKLTHLNSPRILMQPGWQSSGSDHWQTLWERRLGPSARRVEQRDWFHLDKADWVATLTSTVAAEEQPVIIVAHSIGCIATAMVLAGSSSSPSEEIEAARRQIVAVILVAPADSERPYADPEVAAFGPIPSWALGVPALVIASTDDPYCSLERARAFASAWKADLHVVEAGGHINTEAGFGPWEDGWRLVQGWAERHGFLWREEGVEA